MPSQDLELRVNDNRQMSDFEYLGKVLKAICKELSEENGVSDNDGKVAAKLWSVKKEIAYLHTYDNLCDSATLYVTLETDIHNEFILRKYQ